MKGKIKRWYQMGLWTADMVKKSVVKGILTEAEATDIVN